MHTLLLDVETAPNTAFCWGLWDQTISHDHLKETSYILCWSAKWHGKSKVHFASVEHDSKKKMLKNIHTLMSEADVIITYNGQRFDLPVLSKEFVKVGLPPPAPSKQVDLYRAVKRVFRFESNKLDAVCEVLGLGRKTKHRGFSLWVGCMDGDPACWREMEKYNKNDIIILEKLYNHLLPWIPNHPNTGLIVNQPNACPTCRDTHFQKRGFAFTASYKYQRYQCIDCHSWFRGNKSLSVKGERFIGL